MFVKIGKEKKEELGFSLLLREGVKVTFQGA